MICPICSEQNEPNAPICVACGAPLEEADLASNLLAPGTVLQGGAFAVGRMLGQGGFGITYLGSDARLARSIAIKEFFPAGCARKGPSVAPAGGWTPTAFADAKERFLQEGQLLARFKHPGIVDVFAAFDENNTVYMVMELLEGKSLTALLQERGGRLEEAQAVDVIAQVGGALEEVHRAGLLHRDIKPENIMVTYGLGGSRRVVLIDFGTAKEFAAGRTQGNSVVVTPGYAPLEQYATRAQRGVYTDVYALAATLYHLVGGEPPTPATDRATGVDLIDVRRLNTHVSPAVATAIMTGLAMEAAKRPQSVRAFLQMLRAGVPAWHSGMNASPGTGSSLTGALVEGRYNAHNGHPGTSPATPRAAVAAPNGAGTNDSALVPLSNGIAGTSTFGVMPPIVLNNHKGAVTSLSFSPYGDILASGSLDGTIRLWDAETGRVRERLITEPKVAAVCFSSDGEFLASGGSTGAVHLWHVSSGRVMRTLKGYLDAITCLDFSSDGMTLASGRGRGTVHLWNARSGTFLRQIKVPHSGSINSLSFAPNGHLLAGACWEVIRLWEAPGGESLRELRVQNGRLVNAVAFSPDGKTLASGSDDSMIRLWDVSSRLVRHTLSGHGARSKLYGWVHAVAFSPDGTLLASGGGDTVVKVWDVATGELLETLTGHSDPIRAVAFSPDGKTLAAGSEDRTIRLWKAGV